MYNKNYYKSDFYKVVNLGIVIGLYFVDLFIVFHDLQIGYATPMVDIKAKTIFSLILLIVVIPFICVLRLLEYVLPIDLHIEHAVLKVVYYLIITFLILIAFDKFF